MGHLIISLRAMYVLTSDLTMSYVKKVNLTLFYDLV